MKEGYTLSTEFKQEMIDHIHKLFLKEWWTNDRTLSDTETILRSSDLLFFLNNDDNNKTIGFARVLTDWKDTALIMDVIVHENYRQQGLGKHLINKILSHPKLKNVKKFDLHCKNNLELFYSKVGFGHTPNMIWLRKHQ